jgi:hypothetical protein
MVMWLSKRKFIIQSKRERSSYVADAEDNSILLEPHHGTTGRRFPIFDLKSLQDGLRLRLKFSQLTDTLILPVEDFRLFGKFR